MKKFILIIVALSLFSSCSIVNPGGGQKERKVYRASVRTFIATCDTLGELMDGDTFTIEELRDVKEGVTIANTALSLWKEALKAGEDTEAYREEFREAMITLLKLKTKAESRRTQ